MPQPTKSCRTVIVLNGVPPSRGLLKALCTEATVVGADGGGNTLLDAGITPHAIVGDMDSYEGEPPSTTQVHRDPDQETTDADKAIRWVLEHRSAFGAMLDVCEIALTGTQSDELDHVLGTLTVCARYASRCKLRIVEDVMETFFVHQSRSFRLPVGSKVSLMGIGQARGVTVSGLKWPLKNEDLGMGVRDGVHNEVTHEVVEIAVRAGVLGVFIPRKRGDPWQWPDLDWLITP